MPVHVCMNKSHITSLHLRPNVHGIVSDLIPKKAYTNPNFMPNSFDVKQLETADEVQ